MKTSVDAFRLGCECLIDDMIGRNSDEMKEGEERITLDDLAEVLGISDFEKPQHRYLADYFVARMKDQQRNERRADFVRRRRGDISQRLGMMTAANADEWRDEVRKAYAEFEAENPKIEFPDPAEPFYYLYH